MLAGTQLFVTKLNANNLFLPVAEPKNFSLSEPPASFGATVTAKPASCITWLGLDPMPVRIVVTLDFAAGRKESYELTAEGDLIAK